MIDRLREERKPEGLWAVARRRRWWIYLSVFLCWIAVFVLLADRSTRESTAIGTVRSQAQTPRGASANRELPSTPSAAASRFLYSVGGLFLGAAVGIGLAWLVDVKNERFRQKKDLETLLSVGVLIAIPHLSTPGEQRRAGVKQRLEVAAVAAMFALVLVGNIYIFVRW